MQLRLTRRDIILVALAAVIGATLIVRIIPQPTYTDSFYHYNAAVRFASGQGLTDRVIWTYVGQPETAGQIVPSHLYWMPFTSLVTGASMALFNAPGDFRVAQLPLIALFAGTLMLGYALGWRLGGSRRHAWVAAALTLCSGFFTKFWGEIDTFALYAFAGSLSLLAMGTAGMATERRLVWWALAGVCAGIGHLTRADGLLLPIVGVLVIGWNARRNPSGAIGALAIFVLAYLLVMGGWFARMIAVTGSPLPVGGLQAAWFTEYDDLFRYPPDANAAEFFADGLGLLIETRWTALAQNMQTWLFVEGYIVLMPLMLAGVWRVWKVQRALILPMLLFTLGLHAAMTLVFPFPGWRGGLLHGAAALVPWWAALAATGLDAAVEWIAARRRRWQPATAKVVFSLGMVMLALALTLTNARTVRTATAIPDAYAILRDQLPPNARVLINDPSQFYFYTAIGGAVLPNGPPEVVAEIAARYNITHVIVEGVQVSDDGVSFSRALPRRFAPVLSAPPLFLVERDMGMSTVRVYEIDLAD